MASIEIEEGKQYPIDKGPDKCRLQTSMWHGDSKERVHVNFRVTEGQDHLWVEAIINGADREDGSGENWLLRGYIVQFGYTYVYKFEAFFSIGTRSGWMKFYPV